MKLRHGIRLAGALLLAPAAGLAAAFAEKWVKCRVPVSEGCVWAKAFLTFTIPFYGLVLGVPAGVLAYWIGGRFFRR